MSDDADSEERRDATLSVPMENHCPVCDAAMVFEVTVDEETYARAPVDDRELSAYVAQADGAKRFCCPRCAGG